MSDYTTSYLFAAIARGLCLKIVALVVDNQRPADDLVGAEASGIDGTPGKSCHGKKRRQISGMVRVWPMGWIVRFGRHWFTGDVLWGGEKDGRDMDGKSSVWKAEALGRGV